MIDQGVTDLSVLDHRTEQPTLNLSESPGVTYGKTSGSFVCKNRRERGIAGSRGRLAELES